MQRPPTTRRPLVNTKDTTIPSPVCLDSVIHLRQTQEACDPAILWNIAGLPLPHRSPMDDYTKTLVAASTSFNSYRYP